MASQHPKSIAIDLNKGFSEGSVYSLDPDLINKSTGLCGCLSRTKSIEIMKPSTPSKKYGGGQRRGEGSAFKRDFLQKSAGSSMLGRSLGISLGADPDAPPMDILMEAASAVEKQVHQDFFKQFPDDFDDDDLS